jgi:hypothetical protein
MASVALNRWGPVWPLGFIEVVTPGTPVRITSLVDPTAVAAPENPTVPGAAPSAQIPEYTFSAQQILFHGTKPDTHGTQPNTGNVYICLAGGTRDDPGLIVHTLTPGETFDSASAAMRLNVFNLYAFYLDADNAGDGAMITAFPM